MPKMKPLKEWICDTCHERVSIKDGWLEWLNSRHEGAREFRITHNSSRCYKHTRHPDRADMHLDHFLGTNGLQVFLAMLDVGPVLDPDQDELPAVPERRSFVQAIRRLHIPYYEEARLYFDQARDEGWFMDCNEVAIFLPETCKRIIERYEDDDDLN